MSEIIFVTSYRNNSAWTFIYYTRLLKLLLQYQPTVNNWVGEGCEEAKAVEDNPFPRATSPDARLINGIPVYQLATLPVGRRSAGFLTM